MKLNARTYNRVVTEPFAAQELDNGIHVDLHYMNENPFYLEYASRGKFAIWATLDGKKYDLLIERGYYEVMQELYDVETNNIWMDFWGRCASLRRRYALWIMLPFLLLYFGALLLIMIFVTDETWVFIVGVVGALLASMFGNTALARKMQQENIDAVNRIKVAKGAKKFEKLLKKQDRYTAEFFGYEDEVDEDGKIKEQTPNGEAIETTATIEEKEVEIKNEEIVEAEIIEDELEEKTEIKEEEKNE